MNSLSQVPAVVSIDYMKMEAIRSVEGAEERQALTHGASGFAVCTWGDGTIHQSAMANLMLDIKRAPLRESVKKKPAAAARKKPEEKDGEEEDGEEEEEEEEEKKDEEEHGEMFAVAGGGVAPEPPAKKAKTAKKEEETGPPISHTRVSVYIYIYMYMHPIATAMSEAVLPQQLSFT